MSVQMNTSKTAFINATGVPTPPETAFFNATGVSTPTQTAFPNANTKEECSKCGKMISISHRARHQKSNKCNLESNKRRLPDSSVSENNILHGDKKELCTKCGKTISVSHRARHLKSKQCIDQKEKARKIGAKKTAAPESYLCYMCEIYVDKAKRNRHEQSETHKRRSLNSIPEEWNFKPRPFKKSLRLPAPPLDITKLVARYPKRPNFRKPINSKIDDELTVVVTRKPTRPMRPVTNKKITPKTSKNIKNEINVDNLPADWEQYMDRPYMNISPLESENQNVFSEVKRTVHGDSENIRRIMGKYPFKTLDTIPEIPETNEYVTQYNERLCDPMSPAYQSPLHFPESPAYSALSPTYDSPITSNEIDNNVPESDTSCNKRPCVKCGKLIHKSNIPRHQRSKSCMHNNSIIGNQIPQANPKVTKNNENIIPCNLCGKTIHKSNIPRHQRSKTCQENNKEQLTAPTIDDCHLIETAFKSRLKTYVIDNIRQMRDPSYFLEFCKPLVSTLINDHVQKQNLKVNLVLRVEYKQTVNERYVMQVMNFKTKNQIMYPSSPFETFYTTAKEKLMAELEEFQGRGSGWTIKKVIDLEIRINKYTPFRGSSYVELPKTIRDKKAVINVQNTDQKCFLWSILAALHPVTKHNERTQSYIQYIHEFDHALSGIAFPMKIDDISKFEKLSGVTISVYYHDDNFVIYPLRVTDNESKNKHVNLLYTKDEKNSHYCWIKNLSRLVRSQITKHKGKIWICNRCLQYFGTETLLNKHTEDCRMHDSVKIVLPKKGSVIEFKDYNKSMRVPFVFYADFEAKLNSISSCQPPKVEDGGTSYTNRYQQHEGVSFTLYGVYHAGDYKAPIEYFGENAVNKFVEALILESKNIKRKYASSAIQPLVMTKENEMNFMSSTHCHICGTELLEDKVRDHDHLTGEFRGSAHRKCNINFRKPQFIPVIIHNMSGYDTHLFIRELGDYKHQITVIPNNEERYISFSMKVANGIELRFLDSFKFMNSSLDKLVSILPKSQFKHTTKYFDSSKLELVLRKGIYPYDHMDSIEKFYEEKLPERRCFYNQLNKTDISDEDYTHACKVWRAFDVKNMKEYTMLYNKTDVLLLADVFENFRDICLATYNLDPAWYFTAPGLAWGAMLKTTGIKLELLCDIDQILMIEKGIRGGVSQCSNRHAKANNPYLKDYDSTKPNTYLMYYDANNLYAWSMAQYMPYRNFRWVSTDVDVMKVADDSPEGYILEVDLEYPTNIHDSHSDLPLAPEHRIAEGSKTSKLMTTLYNKEKYVIHYRALKLYLKLGIKLKHIHRVLAFEQKDWIRPYIKLNTQKRKEAKNDFEKDFYKFMNNSPYGKMMENMRNRVNIKLATQDKQVDKWIAKPNFKCRTIFSEHLAAIHFEKSQIKFVKPIYAGMSILDVSKTLMYDFHYNVMKRKYRDNIQLQYTDTDSLIYRIQTEDVYKDMKNMIEYFDTSDYPIHNPYGIPQVNKKVLGKMKDELMGVPMSEFVGLRSKMYATDVEGDKRKSSKKSKGVKKSVIQNEITFEDYKQCLFKDKTLHRSMNAIRSFKHTLYSVEQYKIALSSKDDKRYILPGSKIKSLPWGHYSLITN